MKKTLTACTAAAALALGSLAFGATAAVSAEPAPAQATAQLRTSFPAYTTVRSPQKVTALYSTGVQTLVTTPKCESGLALQQTYYNWLTIAGGHQPYYQKPIYIIVCQ